MHEPDVAIHPNVGITAKIVDSYDRQSPEMTYGDEENSLRYKSFLLNKHNGRCQWTVFTPK